MSRSENAPPPDGWVCEPRACPFDSCYVCDGHTREGYGTYPLPERFELGEN